jgi:hypothetical protein
MLLYELGVAVALTISAACSLVVFYLTRETKGKIQLPIHVDEPGDDLHENGLFDVMKPEDIIDGYAIDADAFWASVSWLCCYTVSSPYVANFTSNRCDGGNFLSCCCLLSYQLSMLSFWDGL